MRQPNNMMLKVVVLDREYNEPKLEDIAISLIDTDKSMAYAIADQYDKDGTAKFAMCTKLRVTNDKELRIITLPIVNRKDAKEERSKPFSVFIKSPLTLSDKGIDPKYLGFSMGFSIMTNHVIVAAYNTKEECYYNVSDMAYNMLKEAYIPDIRTIMISTTYVPSSQLIIPAEHYKH